MLRLASGDTVPFTESYRLCGQCHGDKFRDWRLGVHGKRIGRWDGQKVYFLCVNCHNPHTPGFKGVRQHRRGGRSGDLDRADRPDAEAAEARAAAAPARRRIGDERAQGAPGSSGRTRRPTRGGGPSFAPPRSARPPPSLGGCDFDPQLRKHFKELSKEEIARLLERVREKNRRRFGRETQVDATPAIPGVEFGYGLDLSRCVGCRRCVYACVTENNSSRAKPQIHWIRVLEMDKERGVDLTHAEVYYDVDAVPRPGKFYMPVQCQQCRKPPCVKACPTQATWKEPDGIVVVDYDWCIGCRACMAACPYGARHFNWGEGTLPAAELNPDQHFLGNRPRPRGVVDKCTFCIQRVSQGAIHRLRRGLPGGRPQVRQPPRPGERDPEGDRDEARLRPEGGRRHRADVLLLLRDLTGAIHEGTPPLPEGSRARGRRTAAGTTTPGWRSSASPSSIGVVAYVHQARVGLIATHMRDQVSWAFFIGNFAFLVGVGAAAVMLVIPAYVYEWKPLKEVVLLGELLAVSALTWRSSSSRWTWGARSACSTCSRSSARPTGPPRCSPGTRWSSTST